MAIAALVARCLDKFRALASEESNQLCSGHENTANNELSRFRIWAGNVAAHRTSGQRSLEYRLRDSQSLYAKVMSLLDDLLVALTNCQAHRAGDPDQDQTDSGSEGSDEEELLGFEFDQLAISSPGDDLREIHVIVNLLFRFSMTLRHPSRNDQIGRYKAIPARDYYALYIPHVRAKFPEAENYLVERLGKSISRRRQYFRYREEHHQKLFGGLENYDEDERVPSTIATTVQDRINARSEVTAEFDNETIYTATSFADTETGTSSLRPPPIPEAGVGGDPFECPLCYCIITAPSEQAWRRHVFEDLLPYVCTDKLCRTGSYQYPSRTEWQRHQSRMHLRVWICPFDCGKEFRVPQMLESHLINIHQQQKDPMVLEQITKACARPGRIVPDLRCPLCREQSTSPALWFKHVGKHMQQLALFALPMRATMESSDYDSDGQWNRYHDLDRLDEQAIGTKDLTQDVNTEAQVWTKQENPSTNPSEPRIFAGIGQLNSSGNVTDRAIGLQNEVIDLGSLSKADMLQQEVENLKKLVNTMQDKWMNAVIPSSAKEEEEKEQQIQDAILSDYKRKLADTEEALLRALRKEKELEERLIRIRPKDDFPPIKFKDAVGRKFSFPWHLVKTWKGMEACIKQAFMHVDIIGEYVQAGHYDLTGPDGEIILPQVWEAMIKPDWEIAMHMWPMPEPDTSKKGIE